MRDSLLLRLRSRLAAWFPVILLGVLAMLTYWLDSQVKGGGRGDGSGSKEPDYFVEDFAATSYGADGSVVQQLSAARLTHYPDGAPTQLIAPQLSSTLPARPALRVRADLGRVSADNENVYLSGNVVAERDAFAGKGRITVATEYLHVRPSLETAVTDRRVTITDATGTHVGGGMEVDNKARTIKMRNGVTGEVRAVPK